jgi:hypothetical protein
LNGFRPVLDRHRQTSTINCYVSGCPIVRKGEEHCCPSCRLTSTSATSIVETNETQPTIANMDCFAVYELDSDRHISPMGKTYFPGIRRNEGNLVCGATSKPPAPLIGFHSCRSDLKISSFIFHHTLRQNSPPQDKGTVRARGSLAKQWTLSQPSASRPTFYLSSTLAVKSSLELRQTASWPVIAQHVVQYRLNRTWRHHLFFMPRLKAKCITKRQSITLRRGKKSKIVTWKAPKDHPARRTPRRAMQATPAADPDS